jgi:hypothetical protein
VREELGSLATPLRAELAAASDLLADIVRRDWPFLARVAAVDLRDQAVRFRSALLLLLSASCAGSMKPRPRARRCRGTRLSGDIGASERCDAKRGSSLATSGLMRVGC